MALYDSLFAGLNSAVTSGSTITFNYPTGRNVYDYFPGAEVLDIPGRQVIQSTLFTVSYQKSSAIVTWSGGYTLPQGTVLRLQARLISDPSLAVSIQSLEIHPGYLAGRLYPMFDCGNVNFAVAAVDVLYLAPFRIQSPVAITSLQHRVTTAGTASSVKTAIWPNSNLSNRPVGLPILSDNTGQATTSGPANISMAIAGTLGPGFYWLGTKHTGTLPSMQCLTPSIPAAMQLGNASGVYPTLFTGLSIADTYTNDISATSLAEGAAFTQLTTTIVPNGCIVT